MIKLLVVCHGMLAEGLVHAMQLITGDQSDVIAIRLDEEDSIDGLEKRVEQAVQDRQPGQEVLVLADLFGASPFNVSARVANRNPGVDVVTGVNLGMLLEVVVQRESGALSELAAIAREAGVSGVKVLSELVK